MNLNEMLKTLLCTIGFPVEQDEYTGKEEKYIIFVYEDERPETYADNEVTSDTVSMQIQMVTPKNYNYFESKREIRDLLERAGFFVTSIRSFLGDARQGIEKIRHTVFEVTYTETRMEEK